MGGMLSKVAQMGTRLLRPAGQCQPAKRGMHIMLQFFPPQAPR